MAQSDEVKPISIPNPPRIQSQGIAPSNITPNLIGNQIFQQTHAQTLGPTVVGNTQVLTIRSIIRGNNNQAIGAIPYFIVFFEASLSTNKMIGATLINSGYQLYGPLAIPTFTPHAMSTPSVDGGNDGSDLVFYTSLYNGTGGSKTIYVITNTRFIQQSTGGQK